MATASQDDAVVWPEDAIEVGRIVDAWGLQGGIKVVPFSSDPQALFSSRRWFLQPPENKLPTRDAARVPSLLHITQARFQGDVIVANVRDLADRTAAEALRGCRVFVPRASFPSTQADEYYWHDLIGLAVVNREGESLGTVAGLLDTGAHSVLRVAPATSDAASDASERLIPFVAAYVDGVDLTERRITVDWGLDY
ncbi:MAG: ribosome maturation factor RimM [Methylibium sp.]|uniref:ribosome maturation factor RimM n=1 Tax=Methylibium sp. TaxID=2067992 RepID=UPI00184ACA02|nr:ribosome maturation factor RimM [Methylibium sp.]MBA3596377.1 ribosome maturation factor RimM [Methylibium sp.]